MIECRLFFDIQTDPIELVSALRELPAALVPHRFTVTENRTSPVNVVTNEALFAEFVTQNPLGFLLYTRGKKKNSRGKSGYDLTPNKRDGVVVLTFWDEDNIAIASDFDALFSTAQKFDFKFGFCCEIEEYYHRNMLFYKFPNSSTEAWIGRDLRNTIPGIYWKTAISNDTAEDFDIDLHRLEEASLEYDKIGESVHFFTYFEDAACWQKSANKIDKLCRDQKGIYSRFDLDSALSQGMSRTEFAQILAKFGGR
ncbi:MAG: hypothetical protein ACJAYH_001105 [Celeribacter sp.]|jgi:hypothetical protein